MASATHLAVRMAHIKAGTYVTSPVSSNIMTARLTVILLTPARNAAAPTMAKMPGDMSPMTWPTSRPNSAPPSSAGMMMPEGTLHPNVMMVSTSLTTAPPASRSMYPVLSSLRSCSQIHSPVGSLQSTSSFESDTSPVSRMRTLGYCSSAVTRTTPHSSRTGCSLMMSYLRKRFDQRKLAWQKTPPKTPPQTPRKTKTR
ncbi:hypothetical protein CGRA01v4_11090 [Colletotrichum graminicola]|nr:hypothetical protein CGRA01v4_11090 [Colletotrichum graminicola]